MLTDDGGGWYRWLAYASKLAGHDLDGDENVDGYSLDGAYDAWEAGESAASYVTRTNAAGRPSLKSQPV